MILIYLFYCYMLYFTPIKYFYTETKISRCMNDNDI